MLYSNGVSVEKKNKHTELNMEFMFPNKLERHYLEYRMDEHM